MARDNLSLLFAATSPPVSRPISAPNNASNEADANSNRSDYKKSTNIHANVHVASQSQPIRSSSESLIRDAETIPTPARNMSTSAILNKSATERDDTPITRDATKSDGDLIVNFAHVAAQPTKDIAPPATTSASRLKRFGSNLGSIALTPLRELQLAEKLNAMNIEMEEKQNQKELERMRHDLGALEAHDRVERQQHQHVGVRGREEDLMDQSDQMARELQNKEEEEECKRIKMEADMACQRVTGRYDALLQFLRSCPRGTYEEYVEFLLMGGGRTEHTVLGEDYNSLMFENFYDEHSEYRKLWNDNLTTGLPFGTSTLEGRSFVPTAGSTSDNTVEDIARQRSRTFSAEDKTFGNTLRGRTTSEGERIMKIKQGLGSAVSALSNVSAFALKPLRDLQLAEQINAMNIDIEEAQRQREIEKYNRLQEEDRDLEEMIRMKREAEQSCLDATKEHLLGFIKDNPSAKYNQWIEVFHPENAHDGTLLEGLGKTIDHRFFVEESDHRRLWNENLSTYLESSPKGRDFVPARAKQTNDDGEIVKAEDILSGSVVEDREIFTSHHVHGGSDLIAFD